MPHPQKSGSAGTSDIVVVVVSYQRLELTLRCLDALRQKTRRPFQLVVVDNASDITQREALITQREAGVIDYLYFLPRNMGVSVAANLGWEEQHAASYYVKLDNDIIVQDPAWLDHLIELAEADTFAMAAYKLCPWHGTTSASAPSGLRYQATGACGGGCVCIPQSAHKVLGFWNEEYVYGWEDLEYGNRAVLGGFSLAYMADEDAVLHAGPPVDASLATYQSTKLERTADASGPMGLFLQNMTMFELGLRPIYVDRKFLPTITPDGPVLQVSFKQNPEYAKIIVRQRLFRERFCKGSDEGNLYLDMPPQDADA